MPLTTIPTIATTSRSVFSAGGLWVSVLRDLTANQQDCSRPWEAIADKESLSPLLR